MSISYLHVVVVGAAQVGLTPFMVRRLGQAGFGVWSILYSVMGFSSLVSYGLNVAAMRYTAEHRARDEQDEANRILSTVFVLFLGLGLVLMVLCFALAPSVPGMLNVPRSLTTATKLTLLVMGVTVAVQLLGGVFGNIVYGCQRLDAFRGFAIIQVVMNAALVITALSLNIGLPGVMSAGLISFSGLGLMYAGFLRRVYPEIAVRPRLARLGTLRAIGPYSLRSFFLALSSRILYYTDSVVIGAALGASFVTPYAVAYTLVFGTTYLFSAIPSVFLPRFTELGARAEEERLRRLFLNVTKLSMAIVIPIAVYLAVFGQSVLAMWVGKGNVVGRGTLLVLVAMNVVYAAVSPAGMLLQAVGVNRTFVFSEGVNAGLNLALSILLVRRYGVLGVAVGTALAHTCTSTWLVPLMACKYLKLRAQTFVRRAILPPLAVGVPLLALSQMYVKRWLHPTGFAALGIVGAVMTAAYLVAYLAFGATTAERQMYRRAIRGLQLRDA